MKKLVLPKSIYHFKGLLPKGPSVLILGGTHGDEAAGIKVVENLLDIFRAYESRLVLGNLYIGFGNPEAILLKKRGVTDRNLNRCFVPSYLNNNLQNGDLFRAKELLHLLLNVDYLFDIHSTSSPSEPFVCLNNMSKRHKEILPYFPVNFVLIDPDNILVKGTKQKAIGTTDYYVNTYGKGMGFCYETGLETDTSKALDVANAIFDILIYIGVVKGSKIRVKKRKQVICKLDKHILAKHSIFHYAKGMNKGWKKVKRGDLVGKYKNGLTEIVGNDGFLLFPRAENKIEKGGSLYYIAVEES